jgi:hypothetical protein
MGYYDSPSLIGTLFSRASLSKDTLIILRKFHELNHLGAALKAHLFD